MKNNIPKLHRRFTKSIQKALDVIDASPLAKKTLKVILYGSCARGTTKYNSDVDILMVVHDEAIKKREDVEAFRDIRRTLMGIEESAGIDIKIMSSTNWEKEKSVYLSNVHKEGIDLWGKTTTTTRRMTTTLS